MFIQVKEWNEEENDCNWSSSVSMTFTYPNLKKFKFCPDCGRKTKEGVNYCSNCGRKLTEQTYQQYTPYVPMPPTYYPSYPYWEYPVITLCCEM